MAEAKGLSKPVKLKSDLAAFLGASELPRTEITQKLWDANAAWRNQLSDSSKQPNT